MSETELIKPIKVENNKQECEQHTEEVKTSYCFDWQEEAIKAVFFLTGDLLTKDSDQTLELCRKALKILGHTNTDIAMEISHLSLTAEEADTYRKLFKAIIQRLFEERYGNPHILL